MEQSEPDTSTCRKCGMPLAYDRFVSGSQQGTLRDESLCSYCANPKKREYTPRNAGDNAWVLDTILDVYNSGGHFKRRFAKLASKYTPFAPTKLLTLAEIINSIPEKSPRSRYDAVVLYSGGKDSSYMLLNLARRNIRVCAWMLNQGYQSPIAINNARHLCEKLDIPLVIEEPGKTKMDKLFRIGFELKGNEKPDLVKAVMTYGSACWPCFATIAARATIFCEMHNVPFCFIGTQEGQNRLDLNGQPVLAGRGLPKAEFMVEKFMKPFADLASQKYPEATEILKRGNCRTVLLPFYEIVKKPEIQEQLAMLKEVGWQMPNNTGACSTNCMINELGRHIMRRRFGFDLYQVIDAHERRIGNKDPESAEGLQQPSLDRKAVMGAAKMIKLTDSEAKEYGLTLEGDDGKRQSHTKLPLY